MSEITENVHWLPVVVGAVLSFLLGWLWHSPLLFGKKWAESAGIGSPPASHMAMAALAAQLAATFLLAWIVGVTAGRNALATILLVFAMLALFTVANGLFAKKGNFAIAVEAGFVAAMAVVMIAVQGIF